MIRVFFVLLTVLSIGALACGGGAGAPFVPRPGELGYSTLNGYRISPQGDIVFRNFGGSVYSLDVSDPRDPTYIESDAYSGFNCADGCDVFHVVGGHAFLANPFELAKVPLPNAAIGTWIYELPDGSVHSSQSSVLLPGDVLAIARDPSDEVPGAIVFMDVSDNGPSLITRFPTDHRVSRMALSSSMLVSHTEDHRVVLYDVSDPTLPVETGRFATNVPPAMNIRSFAVRDLDVVFIALSSGVDPVQGYLGWYRFSPDYSSLAEIASSEEYFFGFDEFHRPLLHGDYVFTGIVRDEPVERTNVDTLVLQLTSNFELAEVSRIPGRSRLGGEFAVDPDRGLFYVGGDAVQILDLGVITTGEPAWSPGN